RDLAKADIVESIQVSIQSKSELKEEEKKMQFQQSFFFESSAFSEADIYGLETQTYYDKKQKRAYAFAFVKKEKLINYYKTVISIGLSNTESNFKTISAKLADKNLNDALAKALEIGDELRGVYKAQSVLLAIGVNGSDILRKEEYQQDKNKLEDTFNLILNNDQLSIKGLAAYFSGSINQNIIRKSKSKIFIKQFLFQDYSFANDVSPLLIQLFSTELSKTENITLVRDSASADYTVFGNYTDTPEKVTLTISVKNKSGGLNKLSGALSVKSLLQDGVTFLPIEIRKARLAGTLHLKSDLHKLTVKCNENVNSQYKIKITDPSKANALSNIPIAFTYNNSKSPASIISTTDNSEAIFTIVSIRSPIKNQILTASIDLAGYLNVDTASVDYKKIKKETPLDKTTLAITVTGNVLFCSTKELNLGKELTSPFLREGVKDVLTKKGFEFTTELTKADYMVQIESNTREGSTYDGLYFTYLDASVSLIDQSQKKEVFTSQYADIKGAGTNYEGAGIKAYSLATKKIQTDLENHFSK
ncbi:MAG TPA: hypothetical protein VGQ59_12375, partial [Cyclobacteriaceae bacterium]|nr:hypothetical protein [Cyclobacteriaceae bacterium]